jgi:hypothetical protein
MVHILGMQHCFHVIQLVLDVNKVCAPKLPTVLNNIVIIRVTSPHILSETDDLAPVRLLLYLTVLA